MIFVKQVVIIYDNNKTIRDNNPSLIFTTKEQMERYRKNKLKQPGVTTIHFKYEEK